MKKSQKLRWITMGNDYDWTSKVYADKPRDKMPKEMVDLGLTISRILNLDELHADAAILNCYPEKATLSPHVDRYVFCSLKLTAFLGPKDRSASL
jgi:alkylated DNA repair dioxygenase AlkB